MTLAGLFFWLCFGNKFLQRTVVSNQLRLGVLEAWVLSSRSHGAYKPLYLCRKRERLGEVVPAIPFKIYNIQTQCHSSNTTTDIAIPQNQPLPRPIDNQGMYSKLTSKTTRLLGATLGLPGAEVRPFGNASYN
ncbi:hypothetical protein M9H77_30817 [Catharanthus roseus]|uniref:Uncharacterized protein n=1 Tax=Catharanthus roseus TaxID=4058 RepID=A0ACC0A060_CATRO|nr:hypothetical protein M9H77_30817 [Catharanthus roseus]